MACQRSELLPDGLQQYELERALVSGLAMWADKIPMTLTRIIWDTFFSTSRPNPGELTPALPAKFICIQDLRGSGQESCMLRILAEL